MSRWVSYHVPTQVPTLASAWRQQTNSFKFSVKFSSLSRDLVKNHTLARCTCSIHEIVFAAASIGISSQHPVTCSSHQAHPNHCPCRDLVRRELREVMFHPLLQIGQCNYHHRLHTPPFQSEMQTCELQCKQRPSKLRCDAYLHG